MDKNFMEFWGGPLLNPAKSQKQFEDATAWVRQGFKKFEEMPNLFLKMYGLDKITEGSPDYLKTWEKAQEELSQLFNNYISMLGFVAKNDHQELVKKYEELKEKSVMQEETIKHLRMLLSESKPADHSELAKQFENLIKKQNDQFQNLVDNLSKAYKKSSPGKESGQA